jgi:hypothetical protein
MSEVKKRMAMGLGFTLHMQSIDEESDVIVKENFVNVWGGRYERLDIDEAILFEAALKEECTEEWVALMKKAMGVATKFGLELVGQPKTTGKPVR